MRTFIDYDPTEQALATRIGERLGAAGHSVFIAHRDLKPSDNWTDRIIKEAKAADAVLLVWTPRAADRALALGIGVRDLGRQIQQWAEGKLRILRLNGAPLPLGLRGIVSVDGDEESAPAAAVRALAPHSTRASSEPLVHSSGEAAPAFISHSSLDPEIVEPLFEALRARSISYWSYRGAISGSSGWAAQVVAALRSASCLVACLSPAGAQSSHVLREMYLAMEFGKVIHPFITGKTTLTDDHRYIVAGRQRFLLLPAERLGEQLDLALCL